MTGFSVISAVMIFSLCCWTTTASAGTTETSSEGQEKFIPNTMYKVVGRYAIVREHAEAVTGPCDCPHGELYRRNGFLPLAEDSSDECDQCHGTGEMETNARVGKSLPRERIFTVIRKEGRRLELNTGGWCSEVSSKTGKQICRVIYVPNEARPNEPTPYCADPTRSPKVGDRVRVHDHYMHHYGIGTIEDEDLGSTKGDDTHGRKTQKKFGVRLDKWGAATKVGTRCIKGEMTLLTNRELAALRETASQRVMRRLLAGDDSASCE